MLRRYFRRRFLPFLFCLNCLLGLSYLFQFRIDLKPTLILTEEDIATEAIRRALGPKTSNASSLVLPQQTTVVIQPNAKYCLGEGRDVYALLMVISSPGNWKAREAIRSNLQGGVNEFNKRRWHGNTHRNNSLLFFSGVSTDPNTQRKLEEEAEMHGDLIIDNLLDTYLNMTVKVLRMFKWIQSNCSKLKFLLKIDDDVHLNFPKFLQYLNSQSDGQEALLIGGHHYTNKKPVRTVSPPYGKWYAPPEVWPQDTYPDFIGGPAYILGSQAVQHIYERSLAMPLFHLEDVFVTGVVGNAALGLKLSGIPGILTDWGPLTGSLVYSSCFVQNQFLIHSVSPQNIKCWTAFNSKDFTCNNWPLVISTMFC